DVGQQRTRLLLDLAGEHDVLADHRRDLLDGARLRAARRERRDGTRADQRRDHNPADAPSDHCLPCGAGGIAGVPGGGCIGAMPGDMPGGPMPGAMPGGPIIGPPAGPLIGPPAPAPVSMTTLPRFASFTSMVLFFFRSATKLSLAFVRVSRNKRCWIWRLTSASGRLKPGRFCVSRTTDHPLSVLIGCATSPTSASLKAASTTGFG